MNGLIYGLLLGLSQGLWNLLSILISSCGGRNLSRRFRNLGGGHFLEENELLTEFGILGLDTKQFLL